MVIFDVKIIKIGKSLGFIVPPEVMRSEKFKIGDEVNISILRPNSKFIDQAFGSAKGALKFKRDKKDRIDLL